MLSLTRKTDYALVALSLLGRRKLDDEGPISARAVAETFGLPQPLLMNILKELAQARLVTSTRGATGGYVLAMDAADITILEVVVAIEGPVRLTQCCESLPVAGENACAVDANTCPARGAVRQLHRRIVGFLDDMTLEELINEIAAEPAAAESNGACCMGVTVGEADLPVPTDP